MHLVPLFYSSYEQWHNEGAQCPGCQNSQVRMYSKPRLIRIRFDWRFFLVLAKNRVDVSSLTSSKYSDIGENHFKWTHLRPNSRLSQKHNEFIDVFSMVHKTSNRHIQLVMRNLEFIISHYLTAGLKWSGNGVSTPFVMWERRFHTFVH